MNETASGQTTPFEWAGPRRTIAASERDGRQVMLSRPRRRCRRMPNRSHAHKLVSTRRRALSPNAEIFTQNRKKPENGSLDSPPSRRVQFTRATQGGRNKARQAQEYTYTYIENVVRVCVCGCACVYVCVCDTTLIK